MCNLSVIITPLRTYLYGQTKFWMEVICLQQLLIEYLEKYKFFKIADAIPFLPTWNRLYNFCVDIFYQHEIVWVRKTVSLIVVQINWLVSIWGQHWHLMGINQYLTDTYQYILKSNIISFIGSILGNKYWLSFSALVKSNQYLADIQLQLKREIKWV